MGSVPLVGYWRKKKNLRRCIYNFSSSIAAKSENKVCSSIEMCCNIAIGKINDIVISFELWGASGSTALWSTINIRYRLRQSCVPSDVCQHIPTHTSCTSSALYKNKQLTTTKIHVHLVLPLHTLLNQLYRHIPSMYVQGMQMPKQPSKLTHKVEEAHKNENLNTHCNNTEDNTRSLFTSKL